MDEGCGIFTFLVITGDERGNVWWSDDRGRKVPLEDPSMARPEDDASGDLWCELLLAEDYTYRRSFLEYVTDLLG